MQLWRRRSSRSFRTLPGWSGTKAKALGVELSLVWFSCDADTMLTHIRRRGAARDAAKLADWAGYLQGLDLEFRPAAPHVVVENSASSEPLQSQAKSFLESLAERSQA